MSKVHQYLKLCPKKSHYAQLCSHLLDYRYAQSYASIIQQGLTSTELCMSKMKDSGIDSMLYSVYIASKWTTLIT